jgi:hypothetical protein
MEVKSITKQAVSHVSGSIRIDWTVTEKGDGTAKSLSGIVFHNGETAGYYSGNALGASSLSFVEGNSFTAEEEAAIMDQVLDDSEQVFGTPETPEG